jgi:hypothetical protein
VSGIYEPWRDFFEQVWTLAGILVGGVFVTAFASIMLLIAAGTIRSIAGLNRKNDA